MAARNPQPSRINIHTSPRLRLEPPIKREPDIMEAAALSSQVDVNPDSRLSTAEYHDIPSPDPQYCYICYGEIATPGFEGWMERPEFENSLAIAI